jgi:hypothetical protein
MNTTARRTPEQLDFLASELTLIARHEADVAADLAAHTPYWSPQPATVEAHRESARALHEEAERLEAMATWCRRTVPGDPDFACA